jgi:hypothetical protein
VVRAKAQLLSVAISTSSPARRRYWP